MSKSNGNSRVKMRGGGRARVGTGPRSTAVLPAAGSPDAKKQQSLRLSINAMKDHLEYLGGQGPKADKLRKAISKSEAELSRSVSRSRQAQRPDNIESAAANLRKAYKDMNDAKDHRAYAGEQMARNPNDNNRRQMKEAIRASENTAIIHAKAKEEFTQKAALAKRYNRSIRHEARAVSRVQTKLRKADSIAHSDVVISRLGSRDQYNSALAREKKTSSLLGKMRERLSGVMTQLRNARVKIPGVGGAIQTGSRSARYNYSRNRGIPTRRARELSMESSASSRARRRAAKMEV